MHCGCAHRFVTNCLSLVAISQQSNFCTCRSKCLLWCISACTEGIFLEHRVLLLHLLKTVHVWLQSDINEGHFTGRTGTVWRFLGFRWTDFPNNSQLSVTGICWKPCVVFWQQSEYSCVTGRAVQLDVCILADFVQLLLNIHLPLHYIRYKQCNCGCNQPHITCNLLEQQWIFWRYFWLQWTDIPKIRNFHCSNTLHNGCKSVNN